MDTPAVLFCEPCGAGYGSLGERPAVCPSCGSDAPNWSTTKPLRFSLTDRAFLRVNKIDPD